MKNILNKVSEHNLQTLINLRLAMLQLQQNNTDSSIETIEKIKRKENWYSLLENNLSKTLKFLVQIKLNHLNI